MNQWWVPPTSALVFACAAFLILRYASKLCDSIVPFDDGPPPGKPNEIVLILIAAVAGYVLGARQFPLPMVGFPIDGWQIPVMAIELLAISALIGCTYTDIRCGIVPDYFTVVPLVVIALAIVALLHSTDPLLGYASPISAVIIAVPFVIASLLSKGRGMGWGDVKLMALGGALLGLKAAVLVACAACIAAVFVAFLRKRRTEPIAFAPYLAATIGAATTFKIFP